MGSVLLSPQSHSRSSALSRAELDRWPVTASRRWGLRMALAAPFLMVAVWAAQRGVASTVNDELDRSGDLIRWGSRDLGEFLGDMYPPIPTAIAGILPGGAAALGVVGALMAGLVVHNLWERLRARATPPWLVAVLLVSVAGTPAFVHLATQDLSGFLGLGLFAVALAGFLRFVSQGDTEGGFVCGLALGLAVACDPVAIIYALSFGVAAPLVALHRYRGEHHAVRASALVIAFPAIGALAGWTFLQWRFTGSSFEWLTSLPLVFAFEGGVVGSLGEATRVVLIGVALSPVFILTQVLLMRRRAEAAVVAVLPVVGLVVSLWLGLRAPTGHTVVLLGMLGIVSVPREPSRRVAAALAVCAVAGFVAATVYTASSVDAVSEWISALG